MAALTSKELSIIEDQLTLEQNMICKYRHYAQTSGDTVIKNKCDEMVQRHQNHYNTLVGLLG